MTVSDTNPHNAIKAFHQQSFNQFYAELTIHKKETNENEDNLFIARLERLSNDINAQEEQIHLGQWIITTCIARYPHLTPRLPRTLFWYFGGECLHYVSDEEIRCFQAIEEDIYALAAEQTVTADDYNTLTQKHITQ